MQATTYHTPAPYTRPQLERKGTPPKWLGNSPLSQRVATTSELLVPGPAGIYW